MFYLRSTSVVSNTLNGFYHIFSGIMFYAAEVNYNSPIVLSFIIFCLFVC